MAPSPTIMVLVKRLREATETVDRLAIIEQLAALPEPSAILHLYYRGRAADGQVARACRAGINARLSQASIEHLTTLERQRSYSTSYFVGGKASVPELESLKNEPDAWGVLALATFDWSGFVRESAVRLLSGRDERQTVPFLLLRSVDWVRQVQAAALAALERRLTVAWAPAFIEHLPLALHLAHQRSRGQLSLLEGVFRLLKEPDARPAVLAGLRSPRGPTRRACFDLALESGVAAAELVPLALADPSPTIRGWGLDTLRAHPDGLPVQELARKCLTDSAAGLRLKALEFAAEAVGTDAQPLLREALLDLSATVRATARTALARSGAFDSRTFYIATLASKEPHALEAALRGLADVGDTLDSAEAVVLLDNPRARVRKAALLVLRRLSTEDGMEAALAGLTDRSRRVSRAASGLLRRHLPPAEADRVLRVILDGDETSALQATSALQGLSLWPRIRGLLFALKRDSIPLRARAITMLDRCAGIQAVHPTELPRSDAKELELLLRSVSGALPLALAALLESVIGRWSATP